MYPVHCCASRARLRARSPGTYTLLLNERITDPNNQYLLITDGTKLDVERGTQGCRGHVPCLPGAQPGMGSCEVGGRSY